MSDCLSEAHQMATGRKKDCRVEQSQPEGEQESRSFSIEFCSNGLVHLMAGKWRKSGKKKSVAGISQKSDVVLRFLIFLPSESDIII